MSEINYSSIYNGLKAELEQITELKTQYVTECIKSYFAIVYSNKHVKFSGLSNKEYLYDISVFDYDVENINVDYSYSLICAIESELGGERASSPSLVEKNVLYDFLKILVSNAQFKIMIAIYSISEGRSDDELLEKIDRMKKLSDNSGNTKNVLIIMIKGSHTIGNSRQIKICSPLVISGHIIRHDESTIQRITS